MAIQYRVLAMLVVLALLYLVDQLPNVLVRRAIQVLALIGIFVFAWYAT